MAKSQQVAALPWRQTENGIEILLVTTRTTKRWLIPKGWTMDGKSDHEAAAIEAYEEAGVRGKMESLSIGYYDYQKQQRNGGKQNLKVQVFTLHVEKILEDWPERAERERQWVGLSHALNIIGEPELIPLVAAFGRRSLHEPSTQPDPLGLFDRLKRRLRKVFG